MTGAAPVPAAAPIKMAVTEHASINDPSDAELSSSNRRHLSEEEVQRFIKDGYLMVRGAFSGELARQIVPVVWSELEIDEKDRSTWRTPVVMLKKVLERPPFPRVYSERYRGAIGDLCGHGRWSASQGVGHWIILLPGFAKPRRRIPRAHWHTDVSLDHPQLDKPDLGLVTVEFFSDIDPGGGGTAIRVGSHAYVIRMIRRAREPGLESNQNFTDRIESATNHLPLVEATGKAGDVLMMHPFTIHAVNANLGNRPRIAAIKLIRMNDTLNLEPRKAGDQSPVEAAIVNALDPGSIRCTG